MYEMIVKVKVQGSVFSNAGYTRTMSFVFRDLIEANRLADFCRAKGFECDRRQIETREFAADAIEDIKGAIKEMSR